MKERVYHPLILLSSVPVSRNQTFVKLTTQDIYLCHHLLKTDASACHACPDLPAPSDATICPRSPSQPLSRSSGLAYLSFCLWIGKIGTEESS